MNEQTALASYNSNTQLPAVKLDDVLKQAGLLAPQIPAKELIGKVFTIRNAKQFASSFKPGEHAYFCRCVEDLTGEVFTTVLGGQTIVEQIDWLVSLGQENPVTVKLSYKDSGSYNGYYVFVPVDGDDPNNPF